MHLVKMMVYKYGNDLVLFGIVVTVFRIDLNGLVTIYYAIGVETLQMHKLLV